MGADLPKQYLELGGRTLLELSLEALLRNSRLEAVMVALHPDDKLAAGIPLMSNERVLRTDGGHARSDSVLAALKALTALAAESDWVLVHDAARPCLPAADLERLLAAVFEQGVGGVLAQPVVDTVKEAGADGRVAVTLDRSRLWRAQTPQMFRLGELYNALDRARSQGQTVTDEASAMELAGHQVQLVVGSACNLKVTVPEDLALAEFYLAGEADAP